jgi:hypothetical protein
MPNIQEMLPFLIPLIAIQFALMIFALVHVLRHPNYRFGNRTLWVVVVVLFQFIGPVAYFAFGRGEDA